jgi:Holliday junction resolvase
MIGSEKELWSVVKGGASDIHWQRIETGGTGRGIPDLNGCRQAIEVWVELKFIKGGFKVGLRPEQCGWLLRRAAVEGRCWILVFKQKDNLFYLAPGRKAREVVDKGLKADGVWKAFSTIEQVIDYMF